MVTSLRCCQKLLLCLSTGSMPASSKMGLQLLLAKAEPITDGGSASETI